MVENGLLFAQRTVRPRGGLKGEGAGVLTGTLWPPAVHGHRGFLPHTARPTEFQHPGFWAVLQDMAPGLETQGHGGLQCPRATGVTAVHNCTPPDAQCTFTWPIRRWCRTQQIVRSAMELFPPPARVQWIAANPPFASSAIRTGINRSGMARPLSSDRVCHPIAFIALHFNESVLQSIHWQNLAHSMPLVPPAAEACGM